MNELKNNKVFPRDVDTLLLIKEVEDYLGLENKDTDKLSNTELRNYIEEIAKNINQKAIKDSHI